MSEPPSTGNRLMAMAQAAALVASVWLVWTGSVLPRLRWQSPATLFAGSLFYVVIAWICGAAGGCGRIGSKAGSLAGHQNRGSR